MQIPQKSLVDGWVDGWMGTGSKRCFMGYLQQSKNWMCCKGTKRKTNFRQFKKINGVIDSQTQNRHPHKE